jgi:large subunit ribosomal protein L25
VENFTIEVAERLDGGSNQSGKSAVGTLSETGKSGSKRCRREGYIPAVAYHKAEKAIPVKVPYKEFTLLAKKARRSQVFTFKSESSVLNGKVAIVKDIQQDYIKGRVLHVDFLTLKEDEPISVEVPVKIVGDSPGVKNQGGILAIVTHEISVRCLPKNIPGSVEVDISTLNLGQSIHSVDLQLPAGVELDDELEETIVSIVASRAGEESAAASVEAAAPAAAGKAPAAKAPAAGKAPAAKAPAGKAPAGKSGK